MTEYNVQDRFISLLKDRHRELLKRQQQLQSESRTLSMEIREFEYDYKEMKKLLGKDAKEKLSGIWSFDDEKDVYKRLADFEVIDPSDKSKSLNKRMIPFFSESYLYETVGKEDARTILALLNSIYDLAGKPADF
jgi:hypothetical protein